MNKSNNYHPKIGAVIALYNPSIELLKNSIKSYINSVDQIFLIDNSDSHTHLDISSEKITHIRIGENIGIAAALNIGLDLCRKYNLQYIITMDQDTIFFPAIDSYPIELFDENTLALYPSIISECGQIQSCRPIQSGAIFSLKVLARIGNFCEKYFIDYVDYEIFKRGTTSGLKVLNVPNIFIKQKNGEKYTGKLLFWKYRYTFSSPLRMYYQTRNAIDYIIKYQDYAQILIFIKLILKILLVSNNKKERIKYFIKGINDWRANKWGKYNG